MTTKRRLDYDILRIASMLAVVYLHTAADALRTPSNAPLWHLVNLLTALCTTAVPIFFMLSGALLLGNAKTAELSTLFRTRLPKVVVPLASWSAVVLLGLLFTEGRITALSSFFHIFDTPVLVPYWFLYALIPMYLISPILKKMADGLSGPHWGYMVGLWLVLTIGLTTIRAFLSWGNLYIFFVEHWTLNLNFIGGYLGYFLLGAALERWKHPPSKKVLWISGVILYLIIAIGTAADTLSTGVYNERFKSYLNLFAVLLAIVIFLLIQSSFKAQSSGRVITALSGLSFGIYLVHPLAITFMGWLWDTLPLYDSSTPLGHLLCYFSIVLGCLVGIFILSSIPVICYLFTGQKYKTACKECNLFALFHKK